MNKDKYTLAIGEDDVEAQTLIKYKIIYKDLVLNFGKANYRKQDRNQS